jgi:hypothetical protein
VDKRSRERKRLSFHRAETIVADEETVYFFSTVEQLVLSVRKDAVDAGYQKPGGEAQELGSIPSLSWFPLIAADDENVYLTMRAVGPTAPIFSASKRGGVRRVATSGVVRGLAASGDAAYYSNEGTGQLLRVSASGDALSVVGGGGYPTAVTTDQSYVYWIRQSLDEDSKYTGAVVARALRGGPELELATFDGYVRDMAVDGECVYWIAGDGDATLMTTAKPTTAVVASR